MHWRACICGLRKGGRSLFALVCPLCALTRAPSCFVTFGRFRYNPDEQKNPRHREFIEKEVKYVSVIPVDQPLLQLIHFTFRLGYLRDIHPGVLDDPMVSRIAHMIGLNHVEIVREISNKVNSARYRQFVLARLFNHNSVFAGRVAIECSFDLDAAFWWLKI